MSHYRHTQVGYIMIIALAIILNLSLGTIGTMAKSAEEALLLPILILFFVFALIASSFVSLTVAVDDQYLRIKFGLGIIRKRFALSEISSVKQVKNSRYHGRGIRIWRDGTHRIRLYNVSGFDAIEIRLKDGRVRRVGTNEPEKLEQALLAKIPPSSL